MSGNKRGMAIGALVGLVVGGSGVAVAAVAVESGVITACVGSGGIVRIPPTAQPTMNPTPSPNETMLAPQPTPTIAPGECQPGEKKISWNQTGPTGPQGPQGPQGPKGETPAQSGQIYFATGSGALSGPAKELAILREVPAGDYLVQASLRYSGGYEKYGVRCDLNATNGEVYQSSYGGGQQSQLHTAQEFYGSMAFHDVVKMTGTGTISLKCYQNWSGGPADVNVQFARLSATATPKLTVFP
ncbi:hypothetical protein [Streptosporangium sp. CA-115845]|uniref:hypothetical protein n=1 Tax=Streptosporangium sp. CA-115845 TaxID=3240071 RepID=UPI003D8AABC9